MTRRLVRMALRAGLRQGWRRGVVGNNRGFLLVGGAALLGHLALRAFEGEAEVVFSEKLLPGQALRILHEAKPDQ